MKKGQNHVIILIEAEEETHYDIKILKKTGPYLNMIKAIYDKVTASIIVNGEN